MLRNSVLSIRPAKQIVIKGSNSLDLPSVGEGFGTNLYRRAELHWNQNRTRLPEYLKGHRKAVLLGESQTELEIIASGMTHSKRMMG